MHKMCIFLINKKIYGPLSSYKSVVKNVSLDPETIQESLSIATSIRQNILTTYQDADFVNTAGVIE
jgi:hypothetical protein